MPKHKLIHKRDGRYYFRKRIPTDLVRAGCYGKAKEIKRALGTSDLATAKKLANSMTVQIEEEFDQKRRDLTQPSTDARTCISKHRNLSDLSKQERTDFIIRHFIAREKCALETRKESNEQQRQEVLSNLKDDLGAMHWREDKNDPLSVPSYREREELKSALGKKGIAVEDINSPEFMELAERFRRAEIESLRRTYSELSGNPFQEFDPLFKGCHAYSPTPQMEEAGKTVGDLCQEYLAHNETRIEKGKMARSTLAKIKMRCRIMSDFFGTGKALATINKEDAVRLTDFLPTIPNNAAKRYKGVPLTAAAQHESKEKSVAVVGPKTIADYMAGLIAMLGFAEEHGWIRGNPLKGRLIRDRLPQQRRRERQTLTADEMSRLFTSPDYLKQRLGGRGTVSARFWLPLLCLFHGMRANEVAGLRVGDIGEYEGVPFISIGESDERRLKNESSTRRIPIHQRLVDLDFLEFSSKRKEEDPGGFLFQGLKPNTNGNMADGVGKWWARFVKSTLGDNDQGGPTGARGIHSLRHSWRNAARSFGIQESIAKHLGGWAQTDEAGQYGWSGALPMLKEKIDSIQYPGVELPGPRQIRRN